MVAMGWGWGENKQMLVKGYKLYCKRWVNSVQHGNCNNIYLKFGKGVDLKRVLTIHTVNRWHVNVIIILQCIYMSNYFLVHFIYNFSNYTSVKLGRRKYIYSLLLRKLCFWRILMVKFLCYNTRQEKDTNFIKYIYLCIPSIYEWRKIHENLNYFFLETRSMSEFVKIMYFVFPRHMYCLITKHWAI